MVVPSPSLRDNEGVHNPHRVKAAGTAQHLAMFNAAERIAGMGTWEWTLPDGGLLWSDNLFRLFGLEPHEITPSVDYVLNRMHPDDRPQADEALRALALEDFGDRALEYRILLAEGVIATHRLIVAAVTSGPRRVVGSVRDVTLERRLDHQLAARVAVTQALDDWTSREQGVEGLLRHWATAMEVSFASFWLPEGSSLVAQAIWRMPSPALEPLAELTRQWSTGISSGLVGRAFVSRQPVISADASARGLSARSAAIRRAGLRGAMIVPAVSGDETLAVVELLSFEPIETTERLLRAMAGIGLEVGHFLRHRRGELTAAVLTARELEVLQLASRGHSAAAIAKALYLSPATVKRHFERAYARLGVPDRAAAVGEAMRRGLIS